MVSIYIIGGESRIYLRIECKNFLWIYVELSSKTWQI